MNTEHEAAAAQRLQIRNSAVWRGWWGQCVCVCQYVYDECPYVSVPSKSKLAIRVPFCFNKNTILTANSSPRCHKPKQSLNLRACHGIRPSPWIRYFSVTSKQQKNAPVFAIIFIVFVFLWNCVWLCPGLVVTKKQYCFTTPARVVREKWENKSETHRWIFQKARSRDSASFRSFLSLRFSNRFTVSAAVTSRSQSFDRVRWSRDRLSIS